MVAKSLRGSRRELPALSVVVAAGRPVEKRDQQELGKVSFIYQETRRSYHPGSHCPNLGSGPQGLSTLQLLVLVEV